MPGIHASPSTGLSLVDAQDARVSLVIHLIDSGPPADLAVATLASSVCLSPSRLRRLFTAQTGMTLSRCIKRLKLQRADDLVCTTFLSIKEIGAAVGLHDQSHFVRDFKLSYGCTPTERRRVFLANKKPLSPIDVHAQAKGF
jgi:transcriptional regulator GlxA family with amidase domain